VRCGDSSAYDVNFGYKTGAAAVCLLLEGKTGNTVVNVDGRKIYFEATSEVIKRRGVDVSEIALYESLGFNFGRKPEKFDGVLEEVTGAVPRHL
jgi:6-phosphofructokinase 1